jgi:hypothetical protein
VTVERGRPSRQAREALQQAMGAWAQAVEELDARRSRVLPAHLRHRRISLLHLGGVPWARIGEHVGQRSLRVTADTDSHVLVDEAELDYAELIG